MHISLKTGTKGKLAGFGDWLPSLNFTQLSLAGRRSIPVLIRRRPCSQTWRQEAIGRDHTIALLAFSCAPQTERTQAAAHLITHVHVSPSFPLADSELRLLRASQFDLSICLKTEGIWIWLDKHYRLWVVRWSFSLRLQYFSFQEEEERLKW